jgi:Ca2+-binding EF-hand superfamily protein
MTRNRIALVAAALLAGAATVAVARPHGGPGGPHGRLSWDGFLDKHDTDGDGAVTREELAATSERFARLDTDGDGRITESELEGAIAGRMFAHLARWADEDRDGALTSAEWSAFLADRDADGDGTLDFHRRAPAGVERRPGPLDGDGDGALSTNEAQALFARFDADGDGQVSAQELPAVLERHGRFGHGPRGMHGLRGALEHLDEDGDGSVSRAEWDAAATRRHGADREHAERHAEMFERIDGNGDGVLSAEELDGFHSRGPRPRGRR